MPHTEHPPPFISELIALARDQLQMQAARAGALIAGSLGVMAMDAALATFVIDTEGAHSLWIAALALLGLSFGLATHALRLPGAKETGPSVARLQAHRGIDNECRLGESLLEDLAADVRRNDRALAGKATPFERALPPLVLAILIDLAGRLL